VPVRSAAALTQSNVVRCNFNNNFAGSNPKGIVGLAVSGTETDIPTGSTGNSFWKAIEAEPGETYLIMVSDPLQGWDGTLGGKPQPTGTYVWLCSYTLFRKPKEMQKGTVMPIR
jgi:hypothetical protein